MNTRRAAAAAVAFALLGLTACGLPATAGNPAAPATTPSASSASSPAPDGPSASPAGADPAELIRTGWPRLVAGPASCARDQAPTRDERIRGSR